MSYVLDACKLIRAAAETIERLKDEPKPDKDQAKLHLAWHHLIDAHTLLMKGDLAPQDVVWGMTKARDLLD